MSPTTRSVPRLLPADLYARLDAYIDGLGIQQQDPRKKGYLIQILHQAQHIFGYLPEEIQKHVANKLFLHHADISGVISFYNFFTTVPKGKITISICLGTACYVKGADKILAEFEKQLGITAGELTPDGLFSLDVLRCVGACGLAPVALVNEKVYGRLKTDDVGRILEEARALFAAHAEEATLAAN